jgi:hypothetical protein
MLAFPWIFPARDGLVGVSHLFHARGVDNKFFAHWELVTVHGQKWRNYEKNATFYLALPVFRDSYIL